MFQLFILDQNKKVVSILDPLLIPTMGKTIFHSIVKNLNHALQHANPAFKDDISKWRCKVPVVRTNSRYECYQCITHLIYLIYSCNTYYNISYLQCYVRLFGF